MVGLNFSKTKKILDRYNIPVCNEKFVQKKKEGLEFVNKVNSPVVLKIFSSEISHITDIGGLKKDIRNEEEFKKAWDDLIQNIEKQNLTSKIEGFLVQEQIQGVELVIGMQRSREFGPVVMFGLGGVMVEVLKDVSFGITPISENEAKEMVKRIKSFQLLKEFRGRPAVNLEKVIEIIINTSKLALENKEVRSIDFNPVIANNKKALVVDTSILYEKNK